jgi:hypothetical protein
MDILTSTFLVCREYHIVLHMIWRARGDIENFCATTAGPAARKRARAGLEVVSKDRRRTEGPSPEIGGASSGCV